MIFRDGRTLIEQTLNCEIVTLTPEQILSKKTKHRCFERLGLKFRKRKRKASAVMTFESIQCFRKYCRRLLQYIRKIKSPDSFTCSFIGALSSFTGIPENQRSAPTLLYRKLKVIRLEKYVFDGIFPWEIVLS